MIEAPGQVARPIQDWRIWLRWIFSLDPFHVIQYWDEGMRKAVKQALASEDFSCVYCHFIYTLPYVAGRKLPLVLDQQNVDRQYWWNKAKDSRNFLISLFSLVNMCKTILFESRYLGFVSAVVSVSEPDRMRTRKMTRKSNKYFILAPNGASTDLFKPTFSRMMLRHKNHTITIGFMGSMDLELNQQAAAWLAEEVLSVLRRQMPEYKFQLVLIGRNPPEKIRRFAKTDPDILVTGTVRDVRPYLSKLDVFTAPLRGGAGTKLRILEAMAMQLPVIASPDATQGIEGLRDGLNFLMASTAGEICNGISRLIADDQLQCAIKRSARSLVVKRYSWDAIIKRLARDLEAVVQNKSKKAGHPGIPFAHSHISP